MRISDWSSDVCSSDLTDAFLVQGLLDPASFFGGDLRLDIERARAVIAEKIATPLGCNVEQATLAMEQAWVAKVAHSLQQFTHIDDHTVLEAFGGGGPFVVCQVAEAAGIQREIGGASCRERGCRDG